MNTVLDAHVRCCSCGHELYVEFVDNPELKKPTIGFDCPNCGQHYLWLYRWDTEKHENA